MFSPDKSLIPEEIVEGYSVLRSFSSSSEVYLCREDASRRLVLVKVFPKSEQEFFEAEIEALLALEGSSLAPKLIAAFPQKTLDRFLLVCEALVGKSLLEIRAEKREAQYPGLSEILFRKLDLLHEKFQRIHGDLNPRNILAINSGGTVDLRFIDWEFSFSRQVVDHRRFEQYRGTRAYAAQIPAGNAVEWEREALRKVLAELSFPQPEVAVRPSAWACVKKFFSF